MLRMSFFLTAMRRYKCCHNSNRRFVYCGTEAAVDRKLHDSKHQERYRENLRERFQRYRICSERRPAENAECCKFQSLFLCSEPVFIGPM